MKPANRERKLVLLFCGAVLLVIAAASLLAPANDDSDKSPTTYNSGTAGIKAAYLLLSDLGYSSERWEQPPSALAGVDAPHAMVIYANPDVPSEKYDAVKADIAAFLQRGGRVLTTGPAGATLLPGGTIAPGTQPFEKLCLTTPEGRGALARAGQVNIAEPVRWDTLTPAVHVEQWCGGDAVVVSYQVGKGTAIWWSSTQPLTNLGLKDDASLKLFLASVDYSHVQDPDHSRPHVLFDEYFHGIQTSLCRLHARSASHSNRLAGRGCGAALDLFLQPPKWPYPASHARASHLAHRVRRIHGPALPQSRSYSGCH